MSQDCSGIRHECAQAKRDMSRCDTETKLSAYTYGHIALAANVRLRQGFLQLTRNAKIAELDLSFSIDKNVRRFHIAMDNLQFVFEEFKSPNHAVCDAC